MSWYLAGGTEENHESVSHNTWCPAEIWTQYPRAQDTSVSTSINFLAVWLLELSKETTWEIWHWRKLINPLEHSVYYMHRFINLLTLLKKLSEAYDITLLSVRLCFPPNFLLCFYTVRLVSKASRRLILPRTSCLTYKNFAISFAECICVFRMVLTINSINRLGFVVET
jgi:hypothetical protein